MSTKNKTQPEEATMAPKDVPWWKSCRHMLAFIGFFGFVNLYALRVNMSVAMVCMINQTALQAPSGGEYSNSSQDNSDDTNCVNRLGSSSRSDGEFVWNKETQGIILGAFFWGYLVTQIPGGWLAQRYGGKRVFGYFMLMTAIATLLTPVGARGSPYILVTLRIIKGLGEGVVFPAAHNMWARWAPPLERSKLIGFTYAGAQVGNVITLPLSGLLCEYGFDDGWGSIFYVFGTFGVIWCVVWMILIADSPAEHPRIKDSERRYIETYIGASKRFTKQLKTPWKDIFSSPAVWAIIVAHTCSNWETYTLLTNIPAYMKEVLKFSIKANGALSAIPYIAFWIFINVGGHVADFFRRRGWRTVVVRKISLGMGTFLPGIFLIATGFITCENPYIAVGLLTVAVGTSGFQYSGCMVNHADIAPPFAGLLFGISNTAATLPGFMAPYAIGRLTTNQTQAEWQTVFYIAAAIYAFGGIFFFIFAKGEILEWVYPYMFDEDNEREGKPPPENKDTSASFSPKEEEVKLPINSEN